MNDRPPRLLIGGRLVAGASELDVINPATGSAFVTAPRADRNQLEEAVEAARRAFSDWSCRSHADRRSHLEAWAAVIEADLPRISRLLTLEQGKPLVQAQMEVMGAVAALRAFAGIQFGPRVLRDDHRELIVQHRRPIGVIAAILPWNFPVYLLMTKVAPALSAGNTVVAKPAPTTPLTALRIAELAVNTLPAGVFNVLVDDNDLGPVLTSHPAVDKVSFTGSTETGRKVMGSAASGLKRLTLELGGNDAAIILDDMTAEAAAPTVFQSAMINAGQVCLATKRVYAPRSIYDGLCDALADLATQTVVGDGLEQGTQMGPVQNRRQFEKVDTFLDEARRNGEVIAGGAALESEGYFIPPTIVRDLPHSSPLVQEEQFGPVLPVVPYDDLDEALSLANSTSFGLGGTVWTADWERGVKVAERVESGTVWVNKHLDLPFDVPFGGIKQSGFGTDSIEEFTQVSIVNAARPDVRARRE